MIVPFEDPSQISAMAPDEGVSTEFVHERNEVFRARILKQAFVVPQMGGGRLVADDHHAGPDSFRDVELLRMPVEVGAPFLFGRCGDRRKGRLLEKAVRKPFFGGINGGLCFRWSFMTRFDPHAVSFADEELQNDEFAQHHLLQLERSVLALCLVLEETVEVCPRDRYFADLGQYLGRRLHPAMTGESRDEHKKTQAKRHLS